VRAPSWRHSSALQHHRPPNRANKPPSGYAGVKSETLGDARFLAALGNPEKMPLYNTGFMYIRKCVASRMPVESCMFASA